MLFLVAISAAIAASDPALADHTLPRSESELPTSIAYYTSILIILLICGGITIAVRLYVWTLYAVLAVFVVSWPAVHEQAQKHTFFDDIDISLRTVIVYAFVVAAMMFSVAAIATDRRHRLSKYRPALWTFAVICLAAIPVTTLLPDPVTWQVLWALQVLSMVCHVIPVTTFTHIDGEDDRLATICAGMLAVLLLTMVALTRTGFIDPERHHFNVDRIAILAGVLFGAFLSLRHVFTVQRSRERALGDALSAAERDAAQSRALLEAERNFVEAREIARRRQEKLATTSHDIMQPLMSLRTTVDEITRESDPILQAEMREAFTYLEKVATGYREETDEEAPPTGTETIPVSLLTDTVDRMFRAEAEAKGLSFEAHPVAAEVTVDPLIMMRVLSNLTSNAINHTASGNVAIRAERDGPAVSLSVSNTGVALDEQAVARFMKLHEKGEDSSGSGLGLGIVKQLSDEAGLALTHRYDAEAGNVFSLRLEAA